MRGPGEDFALALFRKSILKQAKYRQIVSLLGATGGLTCLDVGGDNGVVSLLLRMRGGVWHSADLDPGTVQLIRQLVGERVVEIDGKRTPFPDHFFDRVVIIDFLEHISTDREFAQELRRILKPEGALIVNVPHRKPGSLLNRLRHAMGLTDEWHGHLRTGFSRADLAETLSPHFLIRESRTYSRACSELIDTVLQGQGVVAQSPFLPGTWGHDPAVPKQAYDPEKARKLLDEAGWHRRATRRKSPNCASSSTKRMTWVPMFVRRSI